MSDDPTNPKPQPPAPDPAAVHVRGPVVLAGKTLHRYSGARIFAVNNICRNLDFEADARLGEWKGGAFVNSKGETVTPSRVAQSTRMMLTFYLMTLDRAAVQAVMFDSEQVLAAALAFWDTLTMAEIERAQKLYDTALSEIEDAEVEVVPEKGASPKKDTTRPA